MARHQDAAIREFILRNIEEYPDSITSLTTKKFGLSRAAIGRYMGRLVEEGLIKAEGNTRARRYELMPIVDDNIVLERTALWAEDDIWRDNIRPLMNGVKQNIIDICHYGFTEMFNNIIDHSETRYAYIEYKQTYTTITIEVCDTGIGIFNKIKRDFHLADTRTALLELSKGKLTSDKKRHSGEGIYFTSRMFDKFSILSSGLFYSRTRSDSDDWLIETGDKDDNGNLGTFVTLVIRTDADRTMRSVFDKYQGDDVSFRKTHVPIALGRYAGEQLVSRSQAKRILARFTDFAEVILDFTGVHEIGQAFADEIFRVFRKEHPGTPLYAIGTNDVIDRMIRHVEGTDSNSSSSGE